MIDLLEKKRFVQRRFQTYHELFPWFAGLALGLVAVQFVGQQARRRIP